MMIRKTDPQAVDQLIDKIQVHLDKKLSSLLGEWENNHRAYKNPKRQGQNGFVAEVYKGHGEYRECFYDDNFDWTSFFIVSDESDFVESRLSTDISWIIQGRLSSSFNTAHRADEELRNEVVKAFNSFRGLIELVSTENGIDRVYSEFDTSNLNYDDMSDVHVLRINFTGQYSATCCPDC